MWKWTFALDRSTNTKIKQSVKTNCPGTTTTCAVVVAILNFAPMASAARSTVARETVNPYGTTNTLRALEANKQKQVQAAASWKAFHDFEFTNQLEKTGINFEMRPVDDAAKNYMAVHYDHGTGLAVADIDGD